MYYRSMKSNTDDQSLASIYAPAILEIFFLGLSTIISLLTLFYEIGIYFKEKFCIKHEKVSYFDHSETPSKQKLSAN